MAVLKTTLFVISALLCTYIAMGIIKTSFNYLPLYLVWIKSSRKPIRATRTTAEYDKDDNEIEGTEETEEVIYDSPYEVITEEAREGVYEKLSDQFGPTLAHDYMHMAPIKILIFLGQFAIDTLTWPSTHFCLRINLTKNESRSE